MKPFLLALFLILGVAGVILIKYHIASSPLLFPIVENNKIGYIDRSGKLILPPVYAAGSNFSEGLAAVRLKGRYGFIDTKGHFSIEPKFDMAETFSEGLAIVYEKGNPYFIDHAGQKAFPCDYAHVEPFSNGRALVRTRSEKQGYIDCNGDLIIDTLYDDIGTFHDDLAVVRINSSKNTPYRTGVINAAGAMIIPLDSFDCINDFNEGYAVVYTKDKKRGLIDEKGRVLFLNDTTIPYVYDFADGRSFIRKGPQDYQMIDTRMKTVGSDHFTRIKSDGFRDGYAIVETEKGCGVVDTNAHFVIPVKEQIGECILNGKYFYFKDFSSSGFLWGITSLEGKPLIKPCLDDFDPAGFVNGMLKATINHEPVYLDTLGRIVWQHRPSRDTALAGLNIDYMMQAYFCAHSSPLKRKRIEYKNITFIDPAEMSESETTPDDIPQKVTDKRLKGDSLGIFIDTMATDTFSITYKGTPVYVFNKAKDTCFFNTEDHRLFMTMQAWNEDGYWKDIDYHPVSFCGNSYNTVALEPGAYWKFVIPRYEGEFPTKFRIRLQYIDPLDRKKDRSLYSSSFTGNINPGQFWNKMTYHPQNIMDPHSD